jgi:hypothetical protein
MTATPSIGAGRPPNASNPAANRRENNPSRSGAGGSKNRSIAAMVRFSASNSNRP